MISSNNKIYSKIKSAIEKLFTSKQRKYWRYNMQRFELNYK